MPRLIAAPLVVLLALFTGCASSGAGAPPPSDTAALVNAETFANYLRDEGLFLEGPEYTSTTSYLDASSLTGSILTFLVSTGVSGEASPIIIFPFRDAATAEANVFAIAESRATPGIGGQQARPRDKRVYQNGRLVVTYYGRDSSVRAALRGALGAPARR